jgi:hypothetical protein
LNIGGRIGKPADREQCQAARKKISAQRRSAAPSTVNKNYLPLLRASEKVASVGDLFSLAAKRMAPSERLVYGSAATNSTPSLAELATLHSTVYSPRVAIGDGLRSIDIYCNAA